MIIIVAKLASVLLHYQFVGSAHHGEFINMLKSIPTHNPPDPPSHSSLKPQTNQHLP